MRGDRTRKKGLSLVNEASVRKQREGKSVLTPGDYLLSGDPGWGQDVRQ